MSFPFFRRTSEEERLRMVMWDHYCGYKKEAWVGILRLTRDLIKENEDGEEISTYSGGPSTASPETTEERYEHGGEG